MLLDLIRWAIPIKYRQSIGLWTARQAGRSKLLLYPYLFFLCGAIPHNLELLHGGDCVIRYKGIKILSPRDGIFTSWEVLQDEVYEKYYKLSSGDTVIDIGAYVGMFTVKASLQVGLGGSVIAVEPASANIRYLRENTKTLKNVVIVPVAAGSYCGEGKLSISGASPCHTLIKDNAKATEKVAVSTLDEILAKLKVKKVDFIKVDAEGYEYEILKGAANTLRTNNLRLAVASYHNLPSGDYELPYIVGFLQSFDFNISVVKGYVYAYKKERPINDEQLI